MRSLFRTAVITVVVVLVAIFASPDRSEAGCWECNDLSCLDKAFIGFDHPCEYYYMCHEGDCWWNCGYGPGELCWGSGAVAMSGQIVLGVAPGGEEWSSIEDRLTYDEGAHAYRQVCNGAVVVLDIPETATVDFEAPLSRIVLGSAHSSTTE